MRSTIALSVAILLLGSSSASLSQDFQHVLHGQSPLTQETVDLMYNQFLHEFKDPSLRHFLQSSKTDRKQIFERTLKEVIDHNTDES